MAAGEKVRRLHQSVTGFATLSLLASMLATGASSQTASSAPIERGLLTVEATAAAEIETGQIHDYRLRAAPGEFVRLTIEQRGIDVAVRLVEPANPVALTVNECHADVCSERVVAIVGAESSLVRVQPTEAIKRRGRYTIRFEEQHAATDRDRTRVAAARAFEHGNQLIERNLPSLYDEALRDYGSALEGFRAVGDRQGELGVLILTAALRSETGPGDEALTAARAAEQLARELDDQPSLVFAVMRQGSAFLRLADWPASAKAFGDAAELARAIGDARADALAIFNQASMYGRMGEQERVIELTEYALKTARSAGYVGLEPLLWNNLGIAYKNLGQYQKSLDAYARALDHLGPNDTDARQLILNNMGTLKRSLGKPVEALPLHEQALALARQIGSRDQEARSLNTIGSTYYAMGDYRRALSYHEQALAIRRDTHDVAGEGASLTGQGRALHKLGESERAFEILNQAITLRRRIHDRFGELESLHALAVVERDRGNLMAAIAAVRAAVDLEEDLRARITSPDVRTTFRAAEEDKYELFIDLLQLANRREPERGHSLEALTISERARSRVLLESLLEAHVDLREGIAPALLQRERTLQKQLSDASAQLSRLLARAGVDGAQALAKRLDALNEQYADVEADIRRQSPHYAAMMQPQPATAAEIQTDALDPDTVLLEFALGEERSWLFALARDGIASVELPRRATIDAAARNYYDRLIARQHRSRETAAAYQKRVAIADAALPKAGRVLSEMLLGGIAERLGNRWRTKRLAIVPSGSLDYLPFTALPVPAGAASRRRPSARLGAQHEIVTLPSASVLLAMRKETSGRTPARATLATFADPVFDASDPRLNGKPGAAIQRPLARLPFSRQEATSIAAIARTVDPDGVREAVDFAASRTALLDPAIANYRILHIATHGVVDTERPAQTALIFSLLDEHGATRDGYVRMRDVYNLRLGADLVVLSACETALGTVVKGEGVVGLARAFMYAGAPRVVASLWPVSDLATAELMTRFYRLMLEDGRPPAAALHEAQRAMATNPRWSAPYYWAGFSLQGDWR